MTTLRVTFTPHKKIHAIKYVRELSGLGLKEAKDVVEGPATFTVSVDALRVASIVEQAASDEVYFTSDAGTSVATPSVVLPTPTATGGEWAVRYRSGPNKIDAIKLARELSGMGLKEAKDVVEQQGVVREGLTQAQARAIVERFAAVGSTVDVEPAGSGGTRLPQPSPGRAGTPAVYGRPDESDDF